MEKSTVNYIQNIKNISLINVHKLNFLIFKWLIF